MSRNKIIMDLSAAKQPKQKKPEFTPDFHHQCQARVLFSRLASAKHTRALLETLFHPSLVFTTA
jgi:hypothetical protein